MAITVTERKVGDVVILDLEGKVLIDSCRAVREGVNDVLGRGEKRILLNYERVQLWDQAGWGQVVGSLSQALSEGAQLKLLNPGQKMVAEMWEFHIARVLEWFTDEAEAVSSFKSRRTSERAP